jgi:hypothetical protein
MNRARQQPMKTPRGGVHVTPAVPMCAASGAESHQLGDCPLTLLIQRLDGVNEHLSLDRVDAYQNEAALAF